MGEAAANRDRRARKLVFDFAGPRYRILSFDRVLLARNAEDRVVRGEDGAVDLAYVHSRATSSLIVQIVAAAFEEPRAGALVARMRPRDEEDYDVWLDAMHDIEQPPPEDSPLGRYQVEMRVGDLEWLLGHLKNASLGVPPAMIQWRRALREYAEERVAAATARPTSAKPGEKPLQARAPAPPGTSAAPLRASEEAADG